MTAAAEAQVGVLVEHRHPDDASGEAMQRGRSMDVTATTPRATGLNSRGSIEANGRDVWVLSRINRQESAERQGYTPGEVPVHVGVMGLGHFEPRLVEGPPILLKPPLQIARWNKDHPNDRVAFAMTASEAATDLLAKLRQNRE